MKLWETLEKSNKVRRKGWENDSYVTMDADKKMAEVSQGYTVESITIEEFYADDWEPYKEPTAEPETDEEGKSETQKIRETGSTMKNLGDFFCLVCDVLEKQQKQIDELKIIVGTGTKGNQSSDQSEVDRLVVIMNHQADRICRLEKAQVEHECEIGELKLIAHDHGVHGIESPNTLRNT